MSTFNIYIPRLFLLLIFWLGLLGGSYSQTVSNTEYKFEHLGIVHGLSQSSVLSLHQDRYGFIWIGTRDGLNKYDGYHFEIFRNRIEDASSLGGNIIHDIKEDRRGNIWLATENGLSEYDRENNRFTNYDFPKEKYGSSPINVLWIDRNQTIWAGNRHGLFQFKDRFIPFNSEDFIIKGMVSAISEGHSGDLYVGTSLMGLFRINVSNEKLEKIDVSDKKHNQARVESLKIDAEKRLWVGTYGSGLYLLDSADNLIRHFEVGRGTPSSGIIDNNIRDIEIDNEGKAWIGTFDGLSIIDQELEAVHILHTAGDNKGLSHSSVRSILKDRKGSMWIGTYFGGINLFDDDSQRFDHFYNVADNPFSLSYDVVGSFTGDGNNKLFIGTERGGLNYRDRISDNHDLLGSPESTIKSLITTSKGQVWVGKFKDGLSFYDQTNNRMIGYPEKTQPQFGFLNHSIINCITEDEKGNLWIGIDNNGGVFYFNTASRKFENFPGQEELQAFLMNYPVKSILIHDANLFLASKGKGIVGFNRLTGQITSYSSFTIEGEEVLIDDFNHVFKDKSGLLWFSSNGKGVIAFDPETEHAQRYHHGDGLNNNIVLGTMQDALDNLWFVSLNGITKWNPSRPNIFKNYNYASGFPLEEINEGAFYHQNGEFYLGGSNGYVIMDPLNLKDNGFVPPIALTHLSISNKEVTPGDETGILTKALVNTEAIELNYFQSILTLDFAALNFIRPENNQYAYKLVGFDEGWVYSQQRRNVTYTNLPHGSYTFMVKGSNNDGVWNEDPLKLEILILPPPWRTWWAYGLYLILILAGFYMIRYNAIKSTQLKHSLRLEQLEKEKWKEVHDLKLKYFIDVSHEFRTPLTLILSPLEEILSVEVKDNWVKSRLKIIYFNAKRLLLLIDQILEIREIETGHNKLQSKPLYLSEIIGEIVNSFKSLADSRKIKLVYSEKNLSQTPFLIDQDKLQKIIFNLLSNAFKFSSEGDEITLEVEEKSGYHSFTIKDTGPGIPEEDLPNIFDRFFKKETDNYGAGIGLSLTKSLVEILNGSIKVSSKINEGTVFTFTLPLIPYHSKDDFPIKAAPFLKPIPLEYQNVGLASPSSASNIERDNILIVEDNPDLCSYLKDQLSSQFSVQVAKNGVEGLQKARKNGPALIISDIMMPEMDGLELCKAVKTTIELSHIPVILLTARSSQVNKLEGLEFGADDYISKPFSILELTVRVKNILDNRKRLHEKYKNTAYLPSVSELTFNSFDESLLRNVYQIIEENLDQPNLTVDFLGEKVHMSRVQLFRKIKALTGMPPSDFIREFRMKKACALLESGKFKVAEVAYSVGFQDVKYFGKVFKSQMGKSPTDYINGFLNTAHQNTKHN